MPNPDDASGAPHRFELPEPPPTEQGPVKAWQQSVNILTYLPDPADPNPMFLEKRVYQGSSGRVYPLPYIDRIATEGNERAWQAVHIENEYLRLMVLPEIGGRIHIGLRQNERLRLLLPPKCNQTCARRPRRPVDLRRRRVQLAAASPPRHFHAGGMGDRARARWISHRLVQRPRSDEPHEGHARRLPPSRQSLRGT